MTTTAEVIYEEGALRLLTPVSYPEGTYLSALLTPKPAPDKGDAAYLLTLPPSERNRILAEAAEAAAPEYEADLALLVGERELMAFTALDGEPFTPTQAPDPSCVAEIIAEIAALPMELGGKEFAGT